MTNTFSTVTKVLKHFLMKIRYVSIFRHFDASFVQILNVNVFGANFGFLYYTILISWIIRFSSDIRFPRRVKSAKWPVLIRILRKFYERAPIILACEIDFQRSDASPGSRMAQGTRPRHRLRRLTGHGQSHRHPPRAHHT